VYTASVPLVNTSKFVRKMCEYYKQLKKSRCFTCPGFVCHLGMHLDICGKVNAQSHYDVHSMIAKESSNSVEVNCSLQLAPAPVTQSGSSNSITDADANSERVGLGNVFKQFFKWVKCLA
jgi:hypothetical protein